jgi:hypothetical protein
MQTETAIEIMRKPLWQPQNEQGISIKETAGKRRRFSNTYQEQTDTAALTDSRPTGVDMDLAAFMAEEARGFPVLVADLIACDCPICREAVMKLKCGVNA